MFEFFISAFPHFAAVSALKVFSCSGETWEILTPEQEENLNFQECFRDTTVAKEHRKAPWKHRKWQLLNTSQGLETH